MRTGTGTDTATGTSDDDLEDPLLNNRRDNDGEGNLRSSWRRGGRNRHDSKDKSDAPLPSFSELISLGKPEFPVLFMAVILMVLNQVAQLVNPRLIGNAYDALVDPNLEGDDKWNKINHTMMYVFALHGFGCIAGFLRGSAMSVAGERIVSRLRTTLYHHTLTQEISFFDERKTGDLLSMLGSDATVVKQAISQSWADVIIQTARLIAAITLMFQISPQLALLTLGACFVIFIVCLPFGKAIGKLSKQYQETLGAAQNYPTEAIGAMRTVQSFAAEQRESNKYKSKIGDPSYWWWPSSSMPQTTYSIGFYKSIMSSAFYTFIFGAGFGAMYVSLWYGFKLVSEDKMTLGELTAFQSYIFLIGGSLAHASRSISQLIEARGASSRIFQLLHRKAKISSPSSDVSSTETLSSTSNDNIDVESGRTTLLGESLGSEESVSFLRTKEKSHDKKSITSPNTHDDMEGHIKFENVSFAYPSRPDVTVLNGFNLEIKKNTTTALVGSSGAGKSTVIALLQRFYEVSSGSIKIDGFDIRNMNLKLMRKNIGCVQQEPQLFGMTVWENVAYGMDENENVTNEAIINVCKQANAYNFVSEWPEGFQTTVGERGVKLSGGQKQRIAIARSMLIGPKILLLDEATSALDAESEHLVKEAIEKASEGRTVLIVAHRLSTIKGADQIVVMDNGRNSSTDGKGTGSCIRDIGTHEELLQRCETYQNLIKRQSSTIALPSSTKP